MSIKTYKYQIMFYASSFDLPSDGVFADETSYPLAYGELQHSHTSRILFWMRLQQIQKQNIPRPNLQQPSSTQLVLRDQK